MTTSLVLILAACSTAGGNSTTSPTTPLPTSSTTISILTTTTNTESITAPEECVERDGVARDRRGFICPPHLNVLEKTGGDLYRKGRYRTRLFEPALTFARTEPFPSGGESFVAVELTADPKPVVHGTYQHVTAFGPPFSEFYAALPTATPDNKPEGWEWAIDQIVTEMIVGGFPAIRTAFTTHCLVDGPAKVGPDWVCVFNPGDASFWPPVFAWNDRVAVVEVEVPGGPVTILVQSPRDAFDRYWSEVAQPILDSIEFIDP